VSSQVCYGVKVEVIPIMNSI